MAKTSSVEKNNRRRKLADQYGPKRAALKAIIMDQSKPMEEILTQMVSGERVRFWADSTKMQAAGAPQANLPIAPPTKTSIRARPTDRTLAPLAISRKGRKVRKPVRVELSITWMVDSAV